MTNSHSPNRTKAFELATEGLEFSKFECWHRCTTTSKRQYVGNRFVEELRSSGVIGNLYQAESE